MNKTKIDNQTIAHILLDLRQKHHLSQEQLAQTLGNGNLCSKHPYPALNQ